MFDTVCPETRRGRRRQQRMAVGSSCGRYSRTPIFETLRESLTAMQPVPEALARGCYGWVRSGVGRIRVTRGHKGISEDASCTACEKPRARGVGLSPSFRPCRFLSCESEEPNDRPHALLLTALRKSLGPCQLGDTMRGNTLRMSSAWAIIGKSVRRLSRFRRRSCSRVQSRSCSMASASRSAIDSSDEVWLSLKVPASAASNHNTPS